MTKLASMRQSRKAIILITIIVPLFAVAGLMIAAGSGQVPLPPENPKVHKVQVSPVVSQSSYLQQQYAYGRIEAASQAQVGFELSGKVTQIMVDEGDVVTSGTLLATLDTHRLHAQMDELNAALASAQADLKLAKLSFQRVTELVERKLESTQRLDEVEQSSVAAAARVKEIKAKQQTLQVELDKSRLVAQFDAIVVSRPIDSGTVVNAGQAVLVLQQQGQFDARVALAAEEAFALSVGQSAQLVINQQRLQGEVKSIAAQRKLDTRTVDVIFSVKAEQGDAYVVGDLVAFVYQKRVPSDGVWVPKQALTSGIRGLWTLYVVPQTGTQTVTSKSVEILYSEADRAFIRGALNDTDWYVISGTQRLVPKQQVEAHDAQQSVADLGVVR